MPKFSFPGFIKKSNSSERNAPAAFTENNNTNDVAVPIKSDSTSEAATKTIDNNPPNNEAPIQQ